MPLYEYECGACQHRFEIIQKYSDGSPEACPKCGKGPVQRLQSSPAIQFKGTGWYVTDYAGKGKGGGEADKGDSAKGDSAKGETAKREAAKGEAGKDNTKPAAKSETSSGSGDSGGGESKKSDTPASTSTPAAKE